MKSGVLLIDDDDNFRSAVVRALAEEGIQIDEASSVNEGIHLLNKTPEMKVIILDLQFPEGNGRVLLERLGERSKDYRVIVYTGHDGLLPAPKAQNLNVFAYLNKNAGIKTPVQPLTFAINQALKDIEAEQLRLRMEDYLHLQRMINAECGIDEVLEEVCKCALRHINGYTCHIRRLDARKGDYALVAFAGPAKVRSLFTRNKNLSESFSGTVARTGQSYLYHDLQTDPSFLSYKIETLEREAFVAGREYLDSVKAAYLVPIRTDVFDDKHPVEAILNISGSKQGFFTAERVRLVDELVGFAEFAISKQWLQDKRKEILNDYKYSNDLLVRISGTLQEARNGIEIALRGISDIIGPEMISLFFYDERTGLIEKRAECVGGQVFWDRIESYSSGEGLVGCVFENGTALRINACPTKHPQYDSSRAEIDLLMVPSRTIQHYLAVPLKLREKVIGVIRSINKKSSYYDEEYPDVASNSHCLLPRGFSPDCEIIMGIIASNLAVTVDNSELIDKLSDNINQLSTLAKIGQRISANYGLETENLLELIVKVTANVMNAEICMLFLKDREGDKVVLKQSYGIPLIADAYYALGEGNIGRVAQTGQPISHMKAGTHIGKYDTIILESLQKLHGDNTKLTSFMIVPITIEDDSPIRQHKIIGALKVINKRTAHQRFDSGDLSLFKSFASQISVALAMSERNRSLFKLVQGVGHELDNSVTLIVPDAEMSRHELESLKEMLKNSGALNESARGSLEFLEGTIQNIARSAKEARDFAQDLLGISESRFTHRQLTDVNEVLLHEVKQFCNYPPPSVINTSEVQLQFRLSREPLLCNIYVVPFIHAVRNIVANAYQAMEDRPKGKLIITTYMSEKSQQGKGKTACLEISDNGKGIEASKLSRIYDANFSERAGGNGLGLWLVQLSLLRMNAAISVKSKVNKGTTFTIELPISDRPTSIDYQNAQDSPNH